MTARRESREKSRKRISCCLRKFRGKGGGERRSGQQPARLGVQRSFKDLSRHRADGLARHHFDGITLARELELDGDAARGWKTSTRS